jgi:hypothetical protein
MKVDLKLSLVPMVIDSCFALEFRSQLGGPCKAHFVSMFDKVLFFGPWGWRLWVFFNASVFLFSFQKKEKTLQCFMDIVLGQLEVILKRKIVVFFFLRKQFHWSFDLINFKCFMELKGEIFNWHILAHPQTPRKIQMRVRR